MLVSDSLTHSLTDSCLVNLMALNDTNCLMMSQQLLKVVDFPSSSAAVYIQLAKAVKLISWLYYISIKLVG